MSIAVRNLAEITADAKNAAELERSMTFLEGCRLYPKAFMFSFCLSLAVIMEGYDTALIGTFDAMPRFNKSLAAQQVLRMVCKRIRLAQPGNLLSATAAKWAL
jgi:hypothetical protein